MTGANASKLRHGTVIVYQGIKDADVDETFFCIARLMAADSENWSSALYGEKYKDTLWYNCGINTVTLWTVCEHGYVWKCGSQTYNKSVKERVNGYLPNIQHEVDVYNGAKSVTINYHDSSIGISSDIKKIKLIIMGDNEILAERELTSLYFSETIENISKYKKIAVKYVAYNKSGIEVELKGVIYVDFIFK